MRYVYVIKNLVNGKAYVGQTKNPSSRKRSHFYCAKDSDKHQTKRCNQRPLYRAIRKYGEENFLFEILEECDDSIINEREQYWVAQLDSFNPEKGYNLTRGGNQNFEFSDETRKKIGDLWRGHKQTPEHIQHRVESYNANSKNHKSRRHPQRKRSEEERKALSIRQKKLMTPEMRERISQRVKESMKDPALRQKLSELAKERMKDSAVRQNLSEKFKGKCQRRKKTK